MADKNPDTKRSPRNPWVPAGINGGNGNGSKPAPSPSVMSSDVDEWLPAESLKPRRKRAASRNGSNGASNGGHPKALPEAAAKAAARAPRRRHKLPKRASPRERWLIFRLRRSRKREGELRTQIEHLQARIAELEVHGATANGNGNGNGGEPKTRSNGNGSKPKARSNGNGSAPKAGRSTGKGSAPRSTAPPKRKTSTTPAATTRVKATAEQPKRPRARTTKATRPRAAKTGARRATTTRSKSSKLDLNAATFDQLRGLGLSITQTSRLIAHREMAGGFDGVGELDEIKGLSRETIAQLRSRVRVGAR
jgi:DNA uptake protein ComE-like DNA-binding protein